MSRRGGGRRSSEPRPDQGSSTPSPSFQRGGGGDRGRGRGRRGGFTPAPSPTPVRAPPPAASGYLSATAGPSTSSTPQEMASSSNAPPPSASSSASMEELSQEIAKKLSFGSTSATGGSVPVSSKAIVPPPRPQLGRIGRKCTIRANHFVVEVSDRDLFHYDVRNPPSLSFIT
jgi:eukaryotic translation initiation factor 2C